MSLVETAMATPPTSSTHLNAGKFTGKFTRKDDIILLYDLATQCPPCHTCELGYLSDHIPLLLA